MIFVTVGTEKFPFDRLVRVVDLAVEDGRIRDNVFIQTGTSGYVPKCVKYRRFLEFPEMVEMIQKAKLVISHAGVGSFLLCLKLGKIPILFPRSSSLGEHLDDHQLDFVRGVGMLGRILVAYDGKDLLKEIDLYDWLVSKVDLGTASQSGRLAAYLNELGGEEKW